MGFTKGDVIELFEATFRERVALPDGLEDMWFDHALGGIELELGCIEYDPVTEEFGEKIGRPFLNAVAYLMKVYYCEREVSRVNKINNIITKDVTLNGTGETKRYAAADLDFAKERAADYMNKLKTSWFEN